MSLLKTLVVVTIFLTCSCMGADQSAGEAAKPVYHIYAGNTHAHTAFTWSHGDQWQKPPAPKAGEKKEPALYVDKDGAQHPAKTMVLKPDWQKYQARPRRISNSPRPVGMIFTSAAIIRRRRIFNPLIRQTQTGRRRKSRRPTRRM